MAEADREDLAGCSFFFETRFGRRAAAPFLPALNRGSVSYRTVLAPQGITLATNNTAELTIEPAYVIARLRIGAGIAGHFAGLLGARHSSC